MHLLNKYYHVFVRMAADRSNTICFFCTPVVKFSQTYMETVQKLGVVKASPLANYILKNYGPMSHLKLQKLLFYCEAYHLAYFDLPLTNSEYEAWVHGPVSRIVFNEMKDKSLLYSDMKWDGKDDPTVEIEGHLMSTQIEVLHEVLSNLSTWTDLELENATHRESPWIQARKGYSPAEKCSVIIDKSLMRSFYKSDIGL